MRVKAWLVLDDCIERGIELGYNRAFKHLDDPTDSQIKELIYTAIMSEVGEYFEYD